MEEVKGEIQNDYLTDESLSIIQSLTSQGIPLPEELTNSRLKEYVTRIKEIENYAQGTIL